MAFGPHPVQALIHPWPIKSSANSRIECWVSRCIATPVVLHPFKFGIAQDRVSFPFHACFVRGRKLGCWLPRGWAQWGRAGTAIGLPELASCQNKAGGGSPRVRATPSPARGRRLCHHRHPGGRPRTTAVDHPSRTARPAGRATCVLKAAPGRQHLLPELAHGISTLSAREVFG